MKNNWPSLSPLLRSDAQGLLLSWLYLNPEQEWTLSELAEATKISVASVMRDVDRMLLAEFLQERRVGRSRLVSVNQAHPLTDSLTQLLSYSYGPQVVIHNLVKDLPGVRRVFIFGSWAERALGVLGPNPNDVDVLLIGDISMKVASELGLAASHATGREVNFQVLSEVNWDESAGSFVKTVKSGPLLELDVS